MMPGSFTLLWIHKGCLNHIETSTTKYTKCECVCVCVCERERGRGERERGRDRLTETENSCARLLVHSSSYICLCAWNQPLCNANKLAYTRHVKLPSSLIHALMIHHTWSRKLTQGLPMQVYCSLSSVSFQKRFKVCQTFYEKVSEKPQHTINESSISQRKFLE